MASTDRAPMVEPLVPGVDHVRGDAGARVVLEYGDYECPYPRLAFRAIERLVRLLEGRVRFAFRHFPPAQTEELGLDVECFDRGRTGEEVAARIARDVASGEASGVVRGTPTHFVDGVHESGYDTETLLEALAR